MYNSETERLARFKAFTEKAAKVLALWSKSSAYDANVEELRCDADDLLKEEQAIAAGFQK